MRGVRHDLAVLLQVSVQNRVCALRELPKGVQDDRIQLAFIEGDRAAGSGPVVDFVAAYPFTD